jgi:beta-glucosidase-like glycosyl hydrolase
MHVLLVLHVRMMLVLHVLVLLVLTFLARSYLPAYRIGIVEGGALGMMCSYTTVNGTAMCESAEWQQRWAAGAADL